MNKIYESDGTLTLSHLTPEDITFLYAMAGDAAQKKADIIKDVLKSDPDADVSGLKIRLKEYETFCDYVSKLYTSDFKHTFPPVYDLN